MTIMMSILQTISFFALVVPCILPSAWCSDGMAITAEPLAAVLRIQNALATVKLSRSLADDIRNAATDFEKILGNELLQEISHELEGVADSDVQCLNSTFFFVQSLLQKKPWAIKVLDAFGKPGSGIEIGNLAWPGSYEQCLHQIDQNTTSFVPKYCSVMVGKPSNQTESMFSLAGGGIDIGLCVSDKCNFTQVRAFFMKLLEKLKLSELTVTNGQCHEEKVYDWRAILAMSILSVFAVIILIGTFYDVCVFGPAIKNILINADGLLEMETIGATRDSYIQNQGKLTKVLVAFSLHANFTKLISIPKKSSAGQLSALHGIRFFSLTWVILGHTYAFTLSTISADNMLGAMDYLKSFSFQVVANATFSVDSFYFLTGLLTTYLFMREMAKTGKVSLAMFYFHRIWRLTPLYMMVLMVETCLARYFTTGAPSWPAKGFEVDYCKDTWWTNLLYINNFVTAILPDKSMCMGWSWYLANDMQFHLISPFILYPLARSKKLGGFMISAIFLAGTVATYIISSNRHFSPVIIDENTLTADPNQLQDFMNLMYFRPWSHIGPFIVGIIFGYLIHCTDVDKLRMNKHTVAICWCLAIACNVTVLFGVYPQYHGTEWSNAVNALYLATSRTVWAAGLGWLAFACIFGYAGFINKILSMSAWIPLSRLTYSAYLVHPIMMYIYYFNQQVPNHITHFTMVMLYLAFLVTAYAVAAVFSICFESPLMQLEKVFLPKATSGRQKSKTDNDYPDQANDGIERHEEL